MAEARSRLSLSDTLIMWNLGTNKRRQLLSLVPPRGCYWVFPVLGLSSINDRRLLQSPSEVNIGSTVALGGGFAQGLVVAGMCSWMMILGGY